MLESETRVSQKTLPKIYLVLAMKKPSLYSAMGFGKKIANLYLALSEKTPSWFPSLPPNVMGGNVIS